MPLAPDDVGVKTQLNKDADLTIKKAGDLALAKIDLFVNDITPTPQRVIGDYTVATFTGYVQKAVSGWTANRWNTDGTVSTDSTNVVSWAGPGDETAETIYGYLLRSAAGGFPLIRAVRFPAPVPLNAATDILNLVANYIEP